MLSLLMYSTTIAVIAYVWVCVLTQGDNLFGFVPRLYYKHFGAKHPLIENVLFGCAKCFGGQLALWSYPIYYYQSYDVMNHFLTVVFTIFFARIFEMKI